MKTSKWAIPLGLRSCGPPFMFCLGDGCSSMSAYSSNRRWEEAQGRYAIPCDWGRATYKPRTLALRFKCFLFSWRRGRPA